MQSGIIISRTKISQRILVVFVTPKRTRCCGIEPVAIIEPSAYDPSAAASEAAKVTLILHLMTGTWLMRMMLAQGDLMLLQTTVQAQPESAIRPK